MGFGIKITEGDTWYELTWGLQDLKIKVLRATGKRVLIVGFDGECLSTMTRKEFRDSYHYKIENRLLPTQAEVNRIVKLNKELWKSLKAKSL